MEATITRVIVDGKQPLRVQFGKVTREFTDLAHLRSWAEGNLPTQECMQAIAIASVLKEQPQLRSPELIVNRKVSLSEKVASASEVVK